MPQRGIARGGGLAKKLLEETGITEAQPLELISLLGASWSSLIREAKTIKDDRSSSPASPSRM
ncbi:MAG: hypothetical protein E5Y02_32925 [Mesorhizobium sp.]|nr:MAG: hypothetical protein E5Y06_30975 [Mesorhizobium sp.]TJU94264.1 MAG: hypothetical protein E5Y08_30950 [Mesorhizobium sp.]TJV13490.1 MAG: hypothetical protein E5Y07_31390 [Mesorhizobium sp.]TJV37477.1 MAG: hypothetical protein E5Y02_32925 [Mesorhizobium sp.]